MDRSGDIDERVRVRERELRSYPDAWREQDELRQAVGAPRCIDDSRGSDRNRALDYPNDACDALVVRRIAHGTSSADFSTAFHMKCCRLGHMDDGADGRVRAR